MSISCRRATCLIASSWLALGTGAASAQSSASVQAVDPAQSEIAEQSGNDIVVTGTRASLENAEQTKRMARVLIDGISADDIGELPDVSIADSLVRIPGITANDNEGGFDQASIRGLGPDLSLTMFNGRVIATPSPSDRRLPVGLLPTEGISAAYVQKTTDASTIEGGLAGTIDLESIHPLQTKRQGLTLVGRVTFDDIARSIEPAYNFGRNGYRAEATYVGHITDNLGVALTYAYISQSNISPGVQFDGYRTRTGAPSDLDGNKIPDAVPGNAGIRLAASSQLRHSVIGTVQWFPTDSLRLTIDGLYVRNSGESNNTRFYATNVAAAGRAVPTTSKVVSDTVLALDGTNQAGQYQIILTDGGGRNSQYEAGFNLAFDNGGPIKFTTDGYITRATAGSPTRQVTFQNTAATAAAQALPFGYSFVDPSNPTLNFTPVDASHYAVSNVTLGFGRNSDQLKGFAANFSAAPGIPFVESIEFGSRVDARDHEVRPDDLQYNPKTFAQRIALDSTYLASATNPFAPISNYLGGASATSFPMYDIDKVMALVTKSANFTTDNREANDLAGYSVVNEKTLAAYVQVNLRQGPFSGNFGVRWFNTDQSIRGLLGQTFATAIPQHLKRSYDAFLPSFNLRYDITPKLVARFAMSKTVSRPLFSDMQIGANINLASIGNGQLTITRGNPNLKPFSSQNIDGSLEWYPDRFTSLVVQGFRKSVKNFITSATLNDTIVLADGTVEPVLVTSSANDPTTRHFTGVEIIARRDFNFLPGFLANLGARLDYTHNWTDATDTVNSVQVIADPTNTKALADSDPVVVKPNNFTPDILNAQLYYSTERVDLRLAYRYYSAYERTSFNSYQSRPGGQLDLSGSIALLKNVRLVGTVRNITKSKNFQYFGDQRDTTRKSELFRTVIYDGRAVTVGVRARF